MVDGRSDIDEVAGRPAADHGVDFGAHRVIREEHTAELVQVRAEAAARLAEGREELVRLDQAHTAELARVQEQAAARLAERVDALVAAHTAQLETRDARVAAAEQLASERAAERERLETEVGLLAEQIRVLNAATQRSAASPQGEEGEEPGPPARPRRRASKTTND